MEIFGSGQWLTIQVVTLLIIRSDIPNFDLSVLHTGSQCQASDIWIYYSSSISTPKENIYLIKLLNLRNKFKMLLL